MIIPSVAAGMGFLLGWWLRAQAATGTPQGEGVSFLANFQADVAHESPRQKASLSESNTDLQRALQAVAQAARPGQLNEVLVREMESALNDPSWSRGKARWTILLQEMRAEDVDGVLNVIQKRSQNGQWFSPERDIVWERFGSLNIEAALAHPMAGFPLLQHLKTIGIEGYARDHGKEAARLIPEASSPLQADYLKAVLNGISRKDPMAALEILKKHGTPDQQISMVNQVAWGAVYNGGLTVGEQWLGSLPQDGSPQTKAAFSVLCEAARRGHRDVAAEFILRHADKPWCGPEHVSQIIKSFGGASTEQALEFAGRLPASLASVPGLDKLVKRATETNPDQVGLWLREHKSQPGYEAIVRSYADSIETMDPEAANAWRATLQKK